VHAVGRSKLHIALELASLLGQVLASRVLERGREAEVNQLEALTVGVVEVPDADVVCLQVIVDKTSLVEFLEAGNQLYSHFVDLALGHLEASVELRVQGWAESLLEDGLLATQASFIDHLGEEGAVECVELGHDLDLVIVHLLLGVDLEDVVGLLGLSAPD